jgi:deoxyadenosine/deoxycytidine kinase
MPLLITVEGNIGAGKSTLLNELQRLVPHIVVVPEPVHAWTHTVHGNLLDLCGSAPEEWGLTFQTHVLLTCYIALSRALASAGPHDVVVAERSLTSHSRVFATDLCRAGHMSERDVVSLSVWTQLLSAELVAHERLPVYLRCSPDVCEERVRMRGRVEEARLGIQTLRRLHDAMDSEFVASSLVLDAHLPPERLVRDLLKMIGERHSYQYVPEFVL